MQHWHEKQTLGLQSEHSKHTFLQNRKHAVCKDSPQHKENKMAANNLQTHVYSNSVSFLVHLIHLAGAFIQSDTQTSVCISTAEDQGTEVPSPNSVVASLLCSSLDSVPLEDQVGPRQENKHTLLQPSISVLHLTISMASLVPTITSRSPAAWRYKPSEFL